MFDDGNVVEGDDSRLFYLDSKKRSEDRALVYFRFIITLSKSATVNA